MAKLVYLATGQEVEVFHDKIEQMKKHGFVEKKAETPQSKTKAKKTTKE